MLTLVVTSAVSVEGQMTNVFGTGEPQFLPESPKVEVKTIREVDYRELERIVREGFGLTDRVVSIIADLELNNDSQYNICINGFTNEDIELEYGEDVMENLVALRQGNTVTSVPPFMACLEYLSGTGVIQPGEYTVDVMW